MQMILGFLPWILFWVILGFHEPEPAAFSAFFATLIVIINDRRKGKSVKMLLAGTLIFFLILAVAALFTDLNQAGPWVRFWSDAVLVLIALLSILIRKPFTIQYAQEMMPKEYWKSTVFIRTNYVITYAWLTAFGLNLIFPVLKLCDVPLPRWLGTVLSLLIIFAAAKFTKWYSQRSKPK